jgi:hypothetical protein
LQRGETPVLVKKADDLIKVYNLVPDEFKHTLMIIIHEIYEDLVGLYYNRVAGMEIENEKMIKECFTRLQPIVDLYETECNRTLDIGTDN